MSPPAIAAQTLAYQVDANGIVLDAGCGTGLVGQELGSKCDATIDGIDLSPDMLDQARQKGVYRNLDAADLTTRLDIADDRYDGVISVGVFTSGHVGPSAINEMIRVVKPGAPAILTVHENVWEKDGYQAHLDQMEKTGLVNVHEIVDAPYQQKEGNRCKLCILQAA